MEHSRDELVLILKMPGTACNISCRYCAEARKTQTYLRNIKTITLDDIDRLIYLTKDIEYITVLFHGGEPLTQPVSYYEEIISRWRAKRDDVYFGIQTNATLINEEWLDFLDRNRDICGISISLDGDAVANNNRIDFNGNPVFDKVVNALKMLESRQLQTGMISTLTQSATGREQQLFDLISGFDIIRFLKLNPCFDMWKDGSIPDWSILPNEYVKFVITFFNILYTNKWFDKLDVEPIISIIKGLEGVNNSFCNFCDRKCSYFTSVYPGGTLIACDNFDLTDGNYPNIYELKTLKHLETIQPQPLFGQLDKLQNQCQNCDIRKVCTGGCLAARRRYELYGKKHEAEMYCREMHKLVNYINHFINKAKA